jgi:hypothetical protein
MTAESGDSRGSGHEARAPCPRLSAVEATILERFKEANDDQ